MEKNVSFLMTKEEWKSFDKFLHFIACSNPVDKEKMSTPLFNQFKFISLDDFRVVKGITDGDENVKGREMISVAMTNWQCRFIILMIEWAGDTIVKIDKGELPEAIGFEFPKKIFDVLKGMVEVSGKYY
jgi:hypothetical protein